MKKKTNQRKKSKSTSKKEPVKARGKVTHRVNVVKPNGSMPESREVAELEAKVLVGEAMRRAVEELGDVKIDDELAPSQLRQLAEYYEEVTRRQAAFNTKADEAKTAKKALESATELLLERVKAFTHPKSLPLFDQATAEDDMDRMLDAVDANHLAAGGAPVSDDVQAPAS